jgi:hypothetical protein
MKTELTKVDDKEELPNAGTAPNPFEEFANQVAPTATATA